MRLTEQQQEILENFSRWIDMKINAFAGTWKTTMLKLLVENNPNKKFLILVFNRSVKEELTRKFPSNADVFTVHGLAYNKLIWQLNLKNISSEKWLIPQVISEFKVEYEIAQFYMNVLSAYFNSSENIIDEKVVIDLIKNDDNLSSFYNTYSWSISLTKLIKAMKKTFENMINGLRKISYWWYLKYFQLNINKLTKDMNYDAVMLDEWQDTNYVSLSIFNQIPWQKVIVWDTHQWIYGWRWAINAMKSLKYDNFYLSTSFRINKDTASKWDFILKNYKLEKKTLNAYFDQWGDRNFKTCHIFRSNAWLIKRISEMKNYEKFNLTRKVNDIFQVALELNKVVLYYVTWKNSYLEMVENRIKIIALEHRNEEEFWDYIEYVLDDYELVSNWKLIHNIDILRVYDKALNSIDAKSNVFLSTAHTVKWLEFDEVMIENDFINIYKKLAVTFVEKRHWKISEVKEVFYNPKKNTIPIMRSIIEEVNLIYVAVTRAIKDLKINSSAVKLLLSTPKEQFESALESEIKSLKSVSWASIAK